MKKTTALICVCILFSLFVAGCNSGNSTASTELSTELSTEGTDMSNNLAQSESKSDSTESSTEETDMSSGLAQPKGESDVLPWSPEIGEKVHIDMRYYYGTWIVGGMVGSGYVYADIDPRAHLIGGKLIIRKDRITFEGPTGTLILENPRYETYLEHPADIATYQRASYSSFQFQNAFVIRLDVYDGEYLWHPFSLGPIWIKDIDTLIARNCVFHELKREGHFELSD